MSSFVSKHFCIQIWIWSALIIRILGCNRSEKFWKVLSFQVAKPTIEISVICCNCSSTWTSMALILSCMNKLTHRSFRFWRDWSSAAPPSSSRGRTGPVLGGFGSKFYIFSSRIYLSSKPDPGLEPVCISLFCDLTSCLFCLLRL